MIGVIELHLTFSIYGEFYFLVLYFGKDAVHRTVIGELYLSKVWRPLRGFPVYNACV